MFVHNIPPIYNENSKILILGSFPSASSRENQFFYAHPQNRFWPVISHLLDCDYPLSNNETKKQFLLKNRIALWDVISSCDIKGSSDSQIKNVSFNDLSVLTKTTQIIRGFTNGQKAFQLLKKSNQKLTFEITPLPSTSPANAQYSFEILLDKWSEILKYI